MIIFVEKKYIHYLHYNVSYIIFCATTREALSHLFTSLILQQLSIMCDTHDPTTPTSVTNDTADVNARNVTCTGRLLALPVFASVSAALCNAYAITKNSHESVATILGSAEDGVRAGLEFASPVTGKIANVLETPFKAIDNAVCVGLDFVEEKIPSVKLPPDQIYASMKNGLR